VHRARRAHPVRLAALRFAPAGSLLFLTISVYFSLPRTPPFRESLIRIFTTSWRGKA